MAGPEHIGEIAKHTAATGQEAGQNAGAGETAGPLSEKHIATLWMRLATLYGPSRWYHHAGESDDGTWLAALNAAGVTPFDIKRGLESCYRDPGEYPPSAPVEFVRRCQPSDEELGLPTAARGYAIGCRNALGPAHRVPWEHPVVLETCRRVGSAVLTRDAERAWARWEREWGRVVQEYRAGKLPDFGALVTDGRDHEGDGGEGGRRTPAVEARSWLAQLRGEIGGAGE